MSLEKILDRIRAEGEQQSAQMIRQAEEEAFAIRQQADQEAAALYQAACREAQLSTEGECARLLNEARFEARCLAGAARERFVDSALEALQARLARARDESGYAQVLRRLLREVLPTENSHGPPGARVYLEADPRDCKVITDLLHEWGLEIEVRGTLNCLGGVNACSAGRETRVINTLETRLERALPYLRRELAGRFEELVARGAEPPLAEIEGVAQTRQGRPA